ncbi:MAG: sporulation protein YqfD [Bacillota bacterium]|nr:sporulation protein YqfD [Bacillota bacterium]
MRFFLLWLAGFVRVSIRGAAPERFVNLAARHGILLWQLRDGGDCIRALMAAGQFRRTRKLARRSRCRLHVEARGGLPFLGKKVAHRPGLVAGGLLAVLLLGLVNALVLFVEVSGASPGHREEILTLAHASGLRPGTLRMTVDGAALEEQVARALPYVSWARLTFNGTLARLEVGERELPPPPPPRAGPADVMAGKDGELVYFLPLMGVAQVQVGQRVVAGQVLISGLIPGRRVSEKETGPPRLVAAKGVCLARVAYHASVWVPCREVVSRPTGRVWQQWVVFVGGKEIVWKGKVPFDSYETSRTQAAVWGRNGKPLVEVIRTTCHETEPVTFVRARGEAARVARERALGQVLMQVPAAAERESIEAEVQEGEEGATAHVTVLAIEEIGRVVPR